MCSCLRFLSVLLSFTYILAVQHFPSNVIHRLFTSRYNFVPLQTVIRFSTHCVSYLSSQILFASAILPLAWGGMPLRSQRFVLKACVYASSMERLRLINGYYVTKRESHNRRFS